MHVAKIATSEIEDTKLSYPAKRNSSLAESKVRAKTVNKSERSNIATKATHARWESKNYKQ